MFINAHTHHCSNQADVLDLINYFPTDTIEPTAYFSVGLHPWSIHTVTLQTDLERLENLLQHPSCLALGEIGLDKVSKIDFSLQKEVFIQQLHLNKKYNKPVIIHCVRAFQEILSIRKTEQITQPFLFHGYSKNHQLLKQIHDAGCYVSFGKNLCDNQNLQAIFANLKNEVFFLENDNSTISIKDIYQCASQLQEIPLEELKQQITQSFTTVFGPI